MDKKTKYIIKQCGRAEDYCFDYINGASDASDIRRMREYVRCTYRSASTFNKKSAGKR